MKSVLVTGAGGFIGKFLCEELIRQGFNVYGLTRNRSALAKTLPEVHWITADLTRDVVPPSTWDRANAVVHLAGRAHKKRSETDPAGELAVFRTINRDATFSLARQAVDHGVKRFVFLSTIGVLGSHSTRIPFTATDSPNPQTPYAQSKSEAEAELKRLVTGTMMDLVIIRPPLVYGPAAPGNFGKLFRLVNTHLPLPFGSIRNRRSFISVFNLIDLIITSLTHSGAAGETFLASDNHDLSTTDLLRTMIHYAGSRSLLLPVPEPVLRAMFSIAGKKTLSGQLLDSLELDTTHTRKVLGWQPPLTFDEGIRLVYTSRRLSPLTTNHQPPTTNR